MRRACEPAQRTVPAILRRHAPERGSGPMSDDGLPPLRAVIAEHGLSAKKAFGQTFILDLNITRRIARFAGRVEYVPSALYSTS